MGWKTALLFLKTHTSVAEAALLLGLSDPTTVTLETAIDPDDNQIALGRFGDWLIIADWAALDYMESPDQHPLIYQLKPKEYLFGLMHSVSDTVTMIYHGPLGDRAVAGAESQLYINEGEPILPAEAAFLGESVPEEPDLHPIMYDYTEFVFSYIRQIIGMDLDRSDAHFSWPMQLYIKQTEQPQPILEHLTLPPQNTLEIKRKSFWSWLGFK